MNISNFEQYFQNQILERGLDYFHRGMIHTLETDDGHHYIADVDGTEIYTVDVFLNDIEDIVDSSCDCPYDFDDYCKHQAAVLFAIREQNGKRGKSVKKEKQSDLPSMLKSLKKEELIRIILEITGDNPDIKKQLLFTYSPTKNELTASEKLIKEFIRRASRKGFIEWNQVNNALQGAEMVLEKAQSKIVQGDFKNAVLLGITVLSNVVEMIDFSDDSNGSIGAVISWSLHIIDQAISSGLDFVPVQERSEIFEVIVKEAMNEMYDEWSEWRFDLLQLCVPFCGAKELRTKLEGTLASLMKQTTKDSWSGKYDRIQLKKLQLAIMETFDDEEKVEEFIYEHLHLHDFRVMAIEHALAKGQFDKVIQLALEGETMVAKKWPGLVKTFRQYRYQVYEVTGEFEKQKELAVEFLLGNDFSYYEKLKNLYKPNEWSEELNKLLSLFQKENRLSETYLSIIKEERLTAHILDFCNQHLSSVTELYPYFEESHPDELNRLFTEYILKVAEEASDRKKYRGVTSIIKKYSKVCRNAQPIALIETLKETYKRRPAFVDELEKVKI
jgi:hypothetical protein